jgi:uncharacterized protein (TIGR03435 family)
MLRAIAGTGLAVLLAGGLWAQTAATPPSFEVASVKPSAPQPPGRMYVGTTGGPGSADPGQFRVTANTLKNLLMRAYGVKDDQIAGPDWLDSERYDIVAKVPKGATKDDLKPMLQGLLAERFKLTLRHESKDMPMYALVVSKRGLKIKESDPAANDMPVLPPSGEPDGGPPMPLPPLPALPPGESGRPVSRIRMTFSNGRVRMAATKESMAGLAEYLGNQLRRRVTDTTGLNGKYYDVALDFAPDDSTRMMGPMGAMGAMGGMMMAPPPGVGVAVASASDPAGPSLFTALEDQLGLKLEATKGPVDVLVVEHAEKVPTEN